MSPLHPALLPPSALPRLTLAHPKASLSVRRAIDFKGFDTSLDVPGTPQRPLLPAEQQPWSVAAWRIRSQTRDVEEAFCRALEAGAHTLCYQTDLGVGLSTLLQRMCAVFNNVQRRRAEAPMQVHYLSLSSGPTAASRLLDALGAAVGYPISISELRYRSLPRVLAGLCEHLRRTRVVGLVIDHLHRASSSSIDRLVEIAEFLDIPPLICDGREGESEAPPVTLVFAGHLAPEALQRMSPPLWATLGGCSAQLRPLSSPEEVRQAIEQSLSLRNPHWTPAAEELISTIHQQTRGLNTHLRTLLQDAAREISTGDATEVEKALGRALAARTGMTENAEETPEDELAPQARASQRLPRNRRAAEKRANATKASTVLRQRGLTGPRR